MIFKRNKSKAGKICAALLLLTTLDTVQGIDFN